MSLNLTKKIWKRPNCTAHSYVTAESRPWALVCVLARAAHAHSPSLVPRAGFSLASRAWAEALGGRCEGLFALAGFPRRSGVPFLGGEGVETPYLG